MAAIYRGWIEHHCSYYQMSDLKFYNILSVWRSHTLPKWCVCSHISCCNAKSCKTPPVFLNAYKETWISCLLHTILIPVPRSLKEPKADPLIWQNPRLVLRCTWTSRKSCAQILSERLSDMLLSLVSVPAPAPRCRAPRRNRCSEDSVVLAWYSRGARAHYKTQIIPLINMSTIGRLSRMWQTKESLSFTDYERMSVTFRECDSYHWDHVTCQHIISYCYLFRHRQDQLCSHLLCQMCKSLIFNKSLRNEERKVNHRKQRNSLENQSIFSFENQSGLANN